MQAYRITFCHDVECNYWGKNKKQLQAESYLNFSELHDHFYPIIDGIKLRAKNYGIPYIWYFYEPFVEITWFGIDKKTNEFFLESVKRLLNSYAIFDIHEHESENGEIIDWFCENENEREFGGKIHSKCSEIAELFYQYNKDIKNGKGKKEQVKRTIHRICNPIGLNYLDEAYICFSRGLICLLFKFFSFKKAIWIYKNIFRQKY